ncbi:MAG: biotin--[Clostridia bacterium]|nr:biotin--[acetyl-CoA-carboxylase] ligase [Clostridia bacterium]
SRNRFIAELLNEFGALYPQIESGAFMEESRRRSNVIGRDVFVLRGDERYPARAVDIDENGSLVVVTERGEKQALHSGEISLRFE